MAAVSRTEYLKRYLSKDDLPKNEKKKTRKKIKTSKDSKIKIIDDDVDLKQLKAERERGLDDLDEAPVVAEIIDERPKHIQQLEQFRKNDKWRLLADDSEGSHESEQDISPVRKNSPGKRLAKDVSPDRQNKDSKTDRPDNRLSSKNKSSSGSPRRSQNRYESKSKPSPVRNDKARQAPLPLQRNNTRHDSNTDSSPGIKNVGRHDSESDQSPPRKNITRHDSGLDQSPPRKNKTRHDSGSDQSPPRKNKSRHDAESDQSPPRKNKSRNDSGSDQSPPRKNKARHDSNSDSDQSPPRKSRNVQNSKSPFVHTVQKMGSSDSDQSPPRKKKPNSESDRSPKRKRNESTSSDQSPPRKKLQKDTRKGSSELSGHKHSSEVKVKKTLGGAKAGLSSAREMMEEAKKLKEKTDRAFQNMDEKLLGKNAATVVRDKETGKRKNTKEEEAKKEEEEKRKEELKKKYEVWGKGLKQQQNRSSALEDQVYEASKPLARYKDDKDLDKLYREEERDEDPMLAYIRSRKKKEEEKSGKKKTKELPKYKGPMPPPNRFNLMPGYRWDGVDRSNGFEKKIFAQAANKKAVQEIAYKWSTEDM